MNKVFSLTLVVLVAVMLSLFPESASAKVMWGKTELVKGQIGKVTILQNTNSNSIDKSNNVTSSTRVFKKGEEYRVYSFKSINGKGYYGLGGGLFVQGSSAVKYETPSKAKLAQLEQESQVANAKINPKVLATVKTEVANLQNAHATFNAKLKTAGMESIDLAFYPLENTIKLLEFKLKKMNTNDANVIRQAYLLPANKTRESVAHKVFEYRLLVKAEYQLLDERKISEARATFKVYNDLKKKSANKPNVLNSKSVNEIKSIENAISKEFAKIDREELPSQNPNYKEDLIPDTKLTNYYFKLVAGPSVPKAEVEMYEEFARYASETTIAEFGYLGGIENILKKYPLTIHAQDRADEKAYAGNWLFTSNGIENNIYFLAKSAHGSTVCCTSTGDPYDDLYFQATMIHEVDTVVLMGMMWEKKKGWAHFQEADPWFSEGFQEYLATKYTDNQKKFGFMINRVLDQKTIKFGKFGITVQNPYSDGLVLIQFLHEKYGKEAVHKVLLSTQPSFEEALTEEIGDYDKLAKDFNIWISTK